MRRLFGITAAAAILLALFAPAALAAEPVATTGSFILSANGSVDVPADQSVETVVVISGSARISGTVENVVIIDGSATLTGATVETLFVADGTADLGAGTTVTGNVRTLRGTVTQQPGAVVQGTVESVDTDLAAFTATVAVLLIPVFIVLFIGMAIVTIVAGLGLAAFGSRQVREVEALIERRPGHVLIAGIAGTVLLPALAFLLMVTVIGAPVGFALLFLVLPFLAFLGWLVAAVWVGDWLVGKMRGEREAGRPYLAAVLGIIVLGVAGMLPFVSAIATLFGFGGLLLAAWRMLRPEGPSPEPVAWTQPVPSAG